MPADERVVDASALGAILFGEPTEALVRKRLGGAKLCAPQLLPFELASVCQKKSKARPSAAESYRAGLYALEDLDIELLPVKASMAMQFADLANLSTYDAAYLSLAVLRGSPLVTLDDRLAKAARGLKVLA